MTEATCPYCGPLSERGTYRDEGDPPDALYCKRCGQPVERTDQERNERALVARHRELRAAGLPGLVTR